MNSTKVIGTVAATIALAACGGSGDWPPVGGTLGTADASDGSVSPGTTPTADAGADAAPDARREPGEVPGAPPAFDAGPLRLLDCGSSLTAPMANERKLTWSFPTRRIRLGQRGAARTLLPDIDVTGVPVQYGNGGGITVSAAAANEPDPLYPIATISPERLIPEADTFAKGYDNYEGGPATGRAIVGDYLDVPDATRITYSFGWGQRGPGIYLEQLVRSPNAIPNTKYVNGVESGHFFGFTIALSVPSVCTLNAIREITSETPTLPNLWARSAANSAQRAQIEHVLVRDGAKLRISVVSNRPRAAVVAALDASACSTANLVACDALAKELVGIASAIPIPAVVNYEALVGDVDPEWTVSWYTLAPISGLP